MGVLGLQRADPCPVFASASPPGPLTPHPPILTRQWSLRAGGPEASHRNREEAGLSGSCGARLGSSSPPGDTVPAGQSGLWEPGDAPLGSECCLCRLWGSLAAAVSSPTTTALSPGAQGRAGTGLPRTEAASCSAATGLTPGKQRPPLCPTQVLTQGRRPSNPHLGGHKG